VHPHPELAMNLLLTATLLLASVLPNANAANMGAPLLRGVDTAAAADDGAVASRRRRQLQNSLGDWDVSAGVMEWGEEAEKGDESSVEQLDEELEEEEEEMEWGEEVEKGDESSFEQLDELEEGEEKQEEEEEEEEEGDESLVEQLEELEEVKEEMAAAHLRSVSYYCGCPSCTQATLNQIAGGHSCGARIDWVMKNKGMSQVSACKLVANEYPSICGKCHADRCGSVTPPAPAPSNGVSAGVMTDRDRSWLKEHNDRRSF
jgi:hypothetical protein